jgi:LacI family transcriptional regulator
MRITIKDVAKRAGVSPATVSRVVGAYGYVSRESRQKVMTAIRQLGYRPNAIARSLVKRSSSVIGMVVTDIQNPFFARLVRGVEQAIWGKGYALFLANSDEDVVREQAILTILEEKQVDGLILVPASSEKTHHLHHLLDLDIPIVLLDRAAKGINVDTVLVDNEKGAYQAVTHLISLGHRRIGLIIDNLDITTNMERMAGYRRALNEAGLPVEEGLIRSCQFTEQSAYEITLEMFRQENPPTALFTANNFMTIGALRALHTSGLRIPDDVAIVGFDDLESSQACWPNLTAVAQPAYAMGTTAAERLLSRLSNNASPPMEIRLQTEFIIRQSCGYRREAERQ